MTKKIYICIPTLNRAAFLVPCLESVAKIETSPDAQISVLLIDNDSEQTAKPVFDSQENFPFPFFLLLPTTPRIIAGAEYGCGENARR